MLQINLPSKQENLELSGQKIFYGSKNLKQIEKIYETNKNSDYTEQIEKLQKKYNSVV